MAEHHNTEHQPVDFLGHLATDIERLVSLISTCDVTTPVATCPGWDVRRLVIHVGTVHRWAAQAAVNDAPHPRPTRPLDPDASEDLGLWLRAGGEALLNVLQTLRPDQPTWHPFATDLVAGVWPRRLTHETSVHRVDAELAVGSAATSSARAVDPALASDGIDEYLSMMIAGAAQRHGRQLPASTLHIHCTDVPGEWLVWAKGSSVTVVREHAKGDVALRGPASSLFLALWGRVWPAQEIDIVGDQAAGAEWLGVGGT